MKEQLASETFDIGEVAIVYNTEFHPEYEGRECTVVGELKLRKSTQTGEACLCYLVEMDHGHRLGGRPYQLRKKKPPRKDRDVVRWADCPWQPENLHV